jgi:hypothetical protein
VNATNETRDTTLTSISRHVTRTQPQLYWEPRSELNCLVHAYNMFRGEKLLTPEGLHSHTCNNLQLDATYLHLVSLEPTDLCAARGDFSFHCLNHYCLTTQSTAFIGKRIVFFTPVEAVFKSLRQHGHRGLLLTASSTGANGHFTAIRRHANGKYYVYDSLHPDVAELNAAYLQRLRSPKECTTTLLLLEIPRYAEYSTAAAGLRTLHDPPVLRDNMDSTSPWEHEGTLSARTFQTQARSFCLPLAINNAVGSNLVSPKQMLQSRAEARADPIAPRPESPCNADGWFAVSDFNFWAHKNALHLHLLQKGQHLPGCAWDTSLSHAILCRATQLSQPPPHSQSPGPDCAIIHQPAGHFVAVVREAQTKQWYVIDPMKWDHQHDVPCCMPMNNSRVRDTYTGTIYFFANLRCATEGWHLHENPGLLDAKSILERHSAVVRAVDAASLPPAPQLASTVPSSKHLQPNQRFSTGKLLTPSIAPTHSVWTLPAKSARAPDRLALGNLETRPPLPRSKPNP